MNTICPYVFADALRAADRTYADASTHERALARVRMVSEFVPDLVATLDALAWMLATGRASTGVVTRVATIRPAAFRQIAERARAHAGSSLREVADVWVSGLLQ